MWYDDYVVTQLCQIWVMGGGFVTKVRLWVGCVIWWSMLQFACFVRVRDPFGSIYPSLVSALAECATIFEFFSDEAIASWRCNLPSPWGKKRRPTVVTAGQELKQTKRSLACFVSIANYIN